MKNTLLRALHALDRNFEEVVCGICLCTMACCIMVQILLRYLFAAAAPWAEEVAVYCMIGAVYFGACLAVRERAHIRIAFIYDLFPDKLRLFLILLSDALWLIFLCVALSQSFILVKFLFGSVHISPGLGIEQKWPQSMVPFGFLLMIFRVLQVYWRWIRSGAKGLPL